MGGGKKSGGGKKIFRRLAPEMSPHFQFASYAPAMQSLIARISSCYVMWLHSLITVKLFSTLHLADDV